MSDVLWIIVGAFTICGLIFGFISSHAMWFSGKLLREMAQVDFDSASLRYKAQQPPDPTGE